MDQGHQDKLQIGVYMNKEEAFVKKHTGYIDYNSSMFPCEYLSDWIRMIDVGGTIIYQNQSMIEGCGNQIGKNCYNPKSYLPIGVKVEEFANKDIVTRRINFEDEIFLVRSTPIYNRNKEIIAIIEDFRNITVEVIAMERIEETARKNQEELEAAKRVQRGILPEKGEHNGLLIDYKYIPSESLSGDMFDVMNIDTNTVAVYIADVVGHGISASLITMFIRQTMRFLVKGRKVVTPKKVLGKLVSRFEELNLNDNIYFTIFYGVYDIRKSEFKYANAGHNAIPVKIGVDGSIELVEGRGLPISLIFSKGKYEENIIKIEEKEKLLFYTDGITETKDYFNEFYGIDNLIHTIKTSKYNLLDDIVNSVSAYRWGAQEDDIALLLVERMKSGESQ